MKPSNPLQMLTENDGISLCILRVLGLVAGVVLIVKFALTETPDYTGFAGAFLSIAAGVIAKFLSEGRADHV